jgi:hypothetical protein
VTPASTDSSVNGMDPATLMADRFYVAVFPGGILRAKFDSLEVEMQRAHFTVGAWTHIVVRQSIVRSKRSRSLSLFANGFGMTVSAPTASDPIEPFSSSSNIVLGGVQGLTSVTGADLTAGATATTEPPLLGTCSGVPDSVKCLPPSNASDCAHPEVGGMIRSECPALCNACIEPVTIEVDELEFYDSALPDNVALELTRRYGPTGLAAAAASCTFGASACDWNEVDPSILAAEVGQPVAVATAGWKRTGSGAPANDHTFGPSAAPTSSTDCTTDSTAEMGPCFLEARTLSTTKSDPDPTNPAAASSSATFSSPWLLRPKVPAECTLSFWYFLPPEAVASGTSAESCETLGWALTVTKDAALTASTGTYVPCTPDNSSADEACSCGSVQFPTIDGSQRCDWRGQEHGSYATAEAACLSQGARLCTAGEIKAGVVADDTCDRGNALMWSSSACGPSAFTCLFSFLPSFLPSFSAFGLQASFLVVS